MMGVNTRRELAYVAARLRDRKNDELMAAGVTIIDPDYHLDRAGRRPSAPTPSSIPACTCRDAPRSAGGCELHSNVRVVDSVIDDDVFVNSFCVIAESRVRPGARLGPFAHLRPAVRRRRTGATSATSSS